MSQVTICFLIKDKKLPHPEVPLENIIDAGGLKEFIEDYVRDQKKYPLTAAQVFYKVMRNIENAQRVAKQIKNVNVEVYFLTPFGVLIEEDPLVSYDKCIDDIGFDRLKFYFDMFMVTDDLYELLESQPDILIAWLNSKIVKITNIFEYIPRSTLSFILLDRAFETKYAHIKIIYPNPVFTRLLKIAEPRVTSENFSELFIKSIARILYNLMLEMGYEKFVEFISNGKDDPNDFFNLILSNESFSTIGESKGDSLLKFFK